jgi:hypothetical protein
MAFYQPAQTLIKEVKAAPTHAETSNSSLLGSLVTERDTSLAHELPSNGPTLELAGKVYTSRYPAHPDLLAIEPRLDPKDQRLIGVNLIFPDGVVSFDGYPLREVGTAQPAAYPPKSQDIRNEARRTMAA